MIPGRSGEWSALLQPPQEPRARSWLLGLVGVLLLQTVLTALPVWLAAMVLCPSLLATFLLMLWGFGFDGLLRRPAAWTGLSEAALWDLARLLAIGGILTVYRWAKHLFPVDLQDPAAFPDLLILCCSGAVMLASAVRLGLRAR